MLSSVSTSLLRFNYFLPSKKVSINEEEENLLLLFLLLKMLAKVDGCTRKYSIFLLLFRVSYEQGLDNWLKLIVKIVKMFFAFLFISVSNFGGRYFRFIFGGEIGSLHKGAKMIAKLLHFPQTTGSFRKPPVISQRAWHASPSRNKKKYLPSLP